jgi:hypothetical protein
VIANSFMASPERLCRHPAVREHGPRPTGNPWRDSGRNFALSCGGGGPEGPPGILGQGRVPGLARMAIRFKVPLLLAVGDGTAVGVAACFGRPLGGRRGRLAAFAMGLALQAWVALRLPLGGPNVGILWQPRWGGLARPRQARRRNRTPIPGPLTASAVAGRGHCSLASPRSWPSSKSRSIGSSPRITPRPGTGTRWAASWCHGRLGPDPA